MRKIIIHYHLFKNAGTSVDAMLKANFPDLWVTREFKKGRPGNNVVQQVRQWVREEKKAVVFSSHTAMLPPPKMVGVEIFPIIFVRHPIDRIASAYAFERKQKGDNPGAAIARNTTLAGYIDVRLALGADSQCSNFQVKRLAKMFKRETGDETERALRAIEALPFVGLVEDYDESIKRLAQWLTPHFADFRPIVHSKNVARDRSLPLEQKLQKIRSEIGEACYARLLEVNAGDLAVYNAVREHNAKLKAQNL